VGTGARTAVANEASADAAASSWTCLAYGQPYYTVFRVVRECIEGSEQVKTPGDARWSASAAERERR
jgi:hypothetical protein